MSEDRTFRSLSHDADREIIWRFCKRSPTGRWSGIAKAQEAIAQRRGPRGKTPSRPLIRAFLAAFPTKPTKRVRKGLPAKYITKWEATQGRQQIIDYHKRYKPTLKASTLQARLGFARACWKFLKFKDPLTWNLDDVLDLRLNPAFLDEQTGLISQGRLVMLRNILLSLDMSEYIKELPTKGHKRAAGQKSEWWLRKDEVLKLKDAIDDISTRMMFIMAVNTGGRIGSYIRAKVGDLYLREEGREWWKSFETKGSTSKKGKPTAKILNQKVLKELKIYLGFLEKHGMAKPEDSLFPRSYQYYGDTLKEAGVKAGICYTGIHPKTKKPCDHMIHEFPLTWHITRHTFATQLAMMKVPIHFIMQQGPWEDASTLLKFYTGADPEEMRSYLNELSL